MRIFRWSSQILQRAVLGVLLCSFAGAAVQAEDGYTDLFNGKDLTGWDGNPELWSVQDGLITGISDGKLKHNQFLVWTGGTVDDFELKFDFRLEGTNNSGCQYRSKRRPEIGEWSVSGYQADIHPAPKYLGMLYEERGRGIVCERGQKVVVDRDGKKTPTPLEGEFGAMDLTQWHELIITCKGNHLVHKLDGVVVADIEDNQVSQAASEGILAFQLHAGSPSKAQFRNVRLKKLKPAADAQSSIIPANSSSQAVVQQGFKWELLYSVSKQQPGDWMSVCLDSRGRVIAADRNGSLYRVKPANRQNAASTEVERLDYTFSGAVDLLWAFDSLYVAVGHGGNMQAGVYRLLDSDQDDQFDSVNLIREIPATGPNGVQSLALSPEQNAIAVLCGHQAELTKFTRSRVPAIWDEDVLLPRLHDRERNRAPAPGGFVARMSPDGKDWELVSVGLNEPRGGACTLEGELLVVDAGNPGTSKTPWERSTLLFPIFSGADFGWRSGSASHPTYYAETTPGLPLTWAVRPGGMASGAGARLPGIYQQGVFICDRENGTLSSVQLEPDGLSYRTGKNELLVDAPCELTDIVINPADGAIYVSLAGSESGEVLYRLTYQGTESVEPVARADGLRMSSREDLKKLESLHTPHSASCKEVVGQVWLYLSHEDPTLRRAARTALEFCPQDVWAGRAMNEQNLQAKLESLLALCRVQKRASRKSASEMDTPVPDWGGFEGESLGGRGILQVGILTSLSGLNWTEFTFEQRLHGLRIVQLAFLRLGQPDPYVRDALLNTLGESLPAKRPETNAMLLEILVYLQSPQVALQGVELLEGADCVQEQIGYAKTLASLREGWTPELQDRYFRWFATVQDSQGSAAYQYFCREIRERALKLLPEDRQQQLRQMLDRKISFRP